MKQKNLFKGISMSSIRNRNVPLSKRFGGHWPRPISLRPASGSHVTERYSFRRWPPSARARASVMSVPSGRLPRVRVSVIAPSSSAAASLLSGAFLPPTIINYVKQMRRRVGEKQAGMYVGNGRKGGFISTAAAAESQGRWPLLLLSIFCYQREQPS